MAAGGGHEGAAAARTHADGAGGGGEDGSTHGAAARTHADRGGGGEDGGTHAAAGSRPRPPSAPSALVLLDAPPHLRLQREGGRPPARRRRRVRALKARWACLQKRTEVKLQDLPVVLGTCCVLHNICETRGEELEP
uniref:DDE Tnp4 domain-containing protein n=1 Tax=Oryza sativa subsp. japonica TaxID=39947 RepID=Q6EPP1_ORYSJ|nr:hypothetical protein [Oryza sativa Japonica Group]